MKMKKFLKPFICFMLAVVICCSAASGAFPADTAASAANVYCNVKFSKPAICCDVNDVIVLTKCGVQFAETETTTASGITWTYNGKSVDTFTPSKRGVYELTAKAGSKSKTIYVVAKNYFETEYVLYRNDFDVAPNNIRVAENTNGSNSNISVGGGNYTIDASATADTYVRILFPQFLDSFGDVKIETSLKIAAAKDDKKWVSVMYRAQNGNYPYYQGLLRHDTALSNGIEISQKNSSNVWEVYRDESFGRGRKGDYNICTITAKGTKSVFNVNGFDVAEYSNTGFATGAMGIQARGAKVMIDYVEISLDGNDGVMTSNDVSFSKPAIRANIGDTIDLKNCDVQFSVNAVYTKGSNITWKKDGSVITSFTPNAKGVTTLTATSGGITKNVYVVTKKLSDSEYVLYENNFDKAPTDFRVIQQTGASVSHDGAGNYIIDASSSDSAYARVLLPSFLDNFGNFKFETRYKETTASSTSNWAALMAHVHNSDFPYMQYVVKYNPSPANGVELEEKSASAAWTTRAATTYSGKTAGAYNTYALAVQSNKVAGYINGTQVISANEHQNAAGALGIQAKGVKLAVDYVKVTLGETTAEEDTSVKCAVSASRPAIGCDAGQTILLSECSVQFTYGSYPVKGSEIVWKKDGKVITEFSDTSLGTHTLTATHGYSTMTVYVIAKRCTESEYILYSNDFTTGPTDYRVPEASNGGKVYPIDGTFVLNGSASADAYVRVLLPFFLDNFGDVRLEASIKLSAPKDTSKWASIIYRSQNGVSPYMQCCYRYNTNVDNGVEIAQRTPSETWNVIQKGSTTAHNAGGYNVIVVETSTLTTKFSINGTEVLSSTATPYYNGAWGFQVRGLTMTIDYIRVSFTENYKEAGLYTIPGGYVDVRDPETQIRLAPAMVTDIQTMAQFNNIQTNCPAIAIMNYEFKDGVAKVTFADGAVTPEKALDKLGAKVIPAFRISDNDDADSLASFLMSRDQRDAYAVSSNVSVLKRAYSNWLYIRGVADYSALGSNFNVEAIRYEAIENSARVMILSESATRDQITQLQDAYQCVWLIISEGKTASVAGTNKGPYGLITPDRATTEYCFKTYYGKNTLVRRTNVIGHRGNPSQAPENTIYGTNVAYKNGANMVENDVYLTTDNVVYVMHDDKLERTTNGTGSILEMTSAQVKKYKVDYFSGVAAQAIPTLEDYFKEVKGKAHQKLVIELKHPTTTALTEGVAALIRKYDIMDQVVVISFIQTNLVNMRKAIPGIAVGWLNWLEFDDTNPVYSTYTALESIQPYNAVCNPGFSSTTPRWSDPVIRDLVYRGVTLWPWTINTKAQFDELWLGNLGGITTDYAQYASNYIESIHWNSASRVISSTYQSVLTDITNSCEVVIIEDTLGITCSAGNITVPQNKNGKASFYYRYKSTTATGQTYYMVTEIRTIQVGNAETFELKSGSTLSLSSTQLTKVTDQYTVATLKNQFKYSVGVTSKDGVELSSSDKVTTGCTVYLVSDRTKKAVIVIKGDVNGDGIVDATDYLLTKSHFLDKTQLTGAYLTAADCDGDAIIAATDYIQLKSHFLGRYNLYK